MKGAIILSKDKKLSISLPKGDTTDQAIENLKKIIEAKSTLFKHAFLTEELEIIIESKKISFPWFRVESTPEEVDAYMRFCTALLDLCKKQKKITAKEKEVGNEKYAMRCFLLRLGFIGEETKKVRKELLKNLSGSPSFKDKKAVKEVNENE